MRALCKGIQAYNDRQMDRQCHKQNELSWFPPLIQRNKERQFNPISWRVAPLRFNLIVYNNKSWLCRRKENTHTADKTLHRNAEEKYINHFPPSRRRESPRRYVTQSQSMTMINTFSTLYPQQPATHRWTIKSSKLFIMHMAHIRKIVSIWFLPRPKLISDPNGREERRGSMSATDQRTTDNGQTDSWTDGRTDGRNSGQGSGLGHEFKLGTGTRA